MASNHEMALDASDDEMDLGSLDGFGLETASEPDSDLDSDLEDADDHEFDELAMPYPTCGLCRFEFEVGEDFVVFDPLSKAFPRIWYDKYCPSGLPDFLAIERGYHPACVALVEKDLLARHWKLDIPLLDSHIYEATGGRKIFYQPPPSFTARRANWLKQSIATDLLQALGGRLPEEICRHIASYCVRERACQIVRDLWMDPRRPKRGYRYIYIGNGSSVWAQHIEIEGLRYVKSLSISRQSKNDTLLFKPKYKPKHNTCLNLYYAENHLGVCQVIINQDDELPSMNTESGLNWCVMRHPNSPFWLRTNTDGIALRYIDQKDPDERVSARSWAVIPNSIDVFAHLPPATRRHNHDQLYYETVRAVDWNSPGVYGYSFHLDANMVRGIIAHKLGESVSCHRDAYGPKDEEWFHMPMDPDERVSELWYRKGAYDEDSSGGVHTLIVRTNKGRNFTPGFDLRCISPPNHSRTFAYKAIAIFPPTGSSRMLYCRSGHKGTGICFEKPTELEVSRGSQQVATWGQHEVQVSLQPSNDQSLKVPYGSITTSASLEDLRTITPCRTWKEDPPDKITGLLFTYYDGRQRCAGQVRLDCLDAPMTVPGKSLWLGARKPFKKQRLVREFYPENMHIVRVCVTEPLPDKEIEYLKVPLTGRLDWSLNRYAKSSISHFEGEARDEIREIMADQKKVVSDYADPEVETFSVLLRMWDSN
ncbi:hypothetical protein F53441_8634 [Fusarium austroafricanum]|uniref:Uncharacterized protein n=1 Tax=Fusarium austroafricanum TaxID=2364996 RepID=A0A8H4NR14_9HYPO|nr:hypothetical protein F53441_8634 [Fusarium austroafricanum]